MEYISKQSLLADLNEATPRSYFAFETMVREYPTEDVTPVVHAHWEHKLVPRLGYPVLICSHCRESRRETSDFCPDCGAKMDEE